MLKTFTGLKSKIYTYISIPFNHIIILFYMHFLTEKHASSKHVYIQHMKFGNMQIKPTALGALFLKQVSPFVHIETSVKAFL